MRRWVTWITLVCFVTTQTLSLIHISWHVLVYYDQQGLLTRRLGITQVPALVSQDGLRLRIDELAVSP